MLLLCIVVGIIGGVRLRPTVRRDRRRVYGLLLRRGVPLPAPFVPDSRLVYERDDLAGGPRSKGGVDDVPLRENFRHDITPQGFVVPGSTGKD